MKAFLIAAVAAALALPVTAGAAAPAHGDWRNLDAENTLVIDTTKGRIIVEMVPLVAPKTVERVKELTREHFYDGLTFHRVVEDFMAQTGDPKGDGTGGSTKPDVAAEFTFKRGPDTPFVHSASPTTGEGGFIGLLPVLGQNPDLMAMTVDGKVQAWGLFCPGTVGMARATDPDSANSQFFLMSRNNGVLDKKYTAFGRVVVGLDVVRNLNVGEPPPNPDKMTKVQILADMPAADRPKLQVIDTQGPAFAAEIKKADIENAYDHASCNLDLPVRPSP